MQSSVFRIRNATRNKHDFYNYDGDGRFDKDRIKGVVKSILKRWKRHLADKELKSQMADIEV